MVISFISYIINFIDDSCAWVMIFFSKNDDFITFQNTFGTSGEMREKGEVMSLLLFFLVCQSSRLTFPIHFIVHILACVILSVLLHY